VFEKESEYARTWFFVVPLEQLIPEFTGLEAVAFSALAGSLYLLRRRRY